MTQKQQSKNKHGYLGNLRIVNQKEPKIPPNAVIDFEDV
jgi:hypothetical protein